MLYNITAKIDGQDVHFIFDYNAQEKKAVGKYLYKVHCNPISTGRAEQIRTIFEQKCQVTVKKYGDSGRQTKVTIQNWTPKETFGGNIKVSNNIPENVKGYLEMKKSEKKEKEEAARESSSAKKQKTTHSESSEVVQNDHSEAESLALSLLSNGFQIPPAPAPAPQMPLPVPQPEIVPSNQPSMAKQFDSLLSEILSLNAIITKIPENDVEMKRYYLELVRNLSESLKDLSKKI